MKNQERLRGQEEDRSGIDHDVLIIYLKLFWFGEYFLLQTLYSTTECTEEKLLSPSLSKAIFSSRHCYKLILRNPLFCLNWHRFSKLHRHLFFVY